MPRKPSTPKYGHHKPTDQARVRLGGNDVYLGKYNSPESHEKYRRVVAEYMAARAIPSPDRDKPRPPNLSINELILGYITWAEGYYVKNGKPTSELGNIKATMRFLKELYGLTPANEFSPLKLKALREKFVQHGYCRRECNRRCMIVRRLYRWGVENELVPGSILVDLSAVKGLAKGRTAAKDYPPVACVPEADLLAILPHLTIPTADLVRFMALTGCRPGEACSMRPVDIDRTKPVWAYKPDSHKTEHHERDRVVLIGPRAQAILAPYLEHRKPGDAVFDPREIKGPGLGETAFPPRRPGRQHMKRKGRQSSFYTPRYLEGSVSIGCRKAGVPNWNPNQLRHAAATRILAESSLDVARAVLGHSDPQMTTRYAAADLKAASEIMGRIG